MVGDLKCIPTTTKSQPYIIGIAGPSCSGKSYLAQHLSAELQAPIFSLDSYYKDLSHLTHEERSQQNFDIPQALDADLLISHVQLIANAQPINIPIYDFASHSRTSKIETMVPAEYVIIEGLFALHWKAVRDIVNTRIFIETSDELCLQRRQVRDVAERGRTAESVFTQFHETVLPMSKLYIEPTRQHADVIVEGKGTIIDSLTLVLNHIKKNLNILPDVSYQTQNVYD